MALSPSWAWALSARAVAERSSRSLREELVVPTLVGPYAGASSAPVAQHRSERVEKIEKEERFVRSTILGLE